MRFKTKMPEVTKATNLRGIKLGTITITLRKDGEWKKLSPLEAYELYKERYERSQYER